jgi:hypothetical protein
VFADLLSTYQENLPSEATLKFELIKRGFKPSTADECLAAFRQSVDYAHYYQVAKQADGPITDETIKQQHDAAEASSEDGEQQDSTASASRYATFESDRIPIRLTGGRRAFLVVPSPFYEADKQRLVAHIDLLLTDDEGKD